METRRLKHFDVYDEIAANGYTSKVIDTRWVDVPKNGAVRSRIVAKQFATGTVHEYFTATPDAVCFRLFLGLLASRPHYIVCVVDAVSAFLQSESNEGYVVRPPVSVRRAGVLWLLRKALPGLGVKQAVAGASGTDVHQGGRLPAESTGVVQLPPSGARALSREPRRRHVCHRSLRGDRVVPRVGEDEIRV